MKILVKSVEDIITLDKLFLFAFAVNGSINFLLEKYFAKGLTVYQLLSYIGGTLVGTFFLVLFCNIFLYFWSKSRIEILPIPFEKAYDGKLLLEIKNNNYGDRFTEVKVDLLKFIPCDRYGEYLKGGDGDFAHLDIKRPDMSFKNGLSEKGFSVDSDGEKVVVEIAENQDGVLKLLFDKIWKCDVFLKNERDLVVYEYYGVAFRVSGKIAGFHFSKNFLHKIVHGIDYRNVIISGEDILEKIPSKVKWVL